MSVGFGIISTANIGHKQIRAILRSKSGKVVALSSRTRKKVEEFAKQQPEFVQKNAKLYDNYEGVISDPNVDAVYIPLPTSMKLDIVKKAAKAGKHIIVDKPVGDDAKQAREMIEVAEKYNVHIIENTYWVHHLRTREVEEKYLKGGTDFRGGVQHVRAWMDCTILNRGNIRYNKELEPMGALGDLGWYACRAVLWGYQYEKPESIMGTIKWDKECEVPLSLSAIFTFSGERYGTMSASFLQASYCEIQLCFADDLVVSIPCFTNPSETDVAYDWNKKHEEKDHLPYSEFAKYYLISKRGGERKEMVAPKCSHSVQIIDDFCDEVLARKADKKCTTGQNWRKEFLLTMQVLDAIVESSKTGKAVKL